MRAMAFAAIERPVDTDPVKLIASMRLSLIIASPTTLPRPMTRLKTPGGTPALTMMSASAHADPGTRSAGLNTTQLP